LSVPELFPANLRKVGEILLNAGTAPEPDQDVAAYIFARLPERYFVFSGTADDGTPKFAIGPSGLVAHTPLFSEACRGA
jgi:hypothetical protein